MDAKSKEHLARVYVQIKNRTIYHESIGRGVDSRDIEYMSLEEAIHCEEFLHYLSMLSLGDTIEREKAINFFEPGSEDAMFGTD